MFTERKEKVDSLTLSRENVRSGSQVYELRI